MDQYFVNVIVGEEDDNGDMNQYGCVCYKFDNWPEASNFIKLSLDNGLVVEARVPSNIKAQQVV